MSRHREIHLLRWARLAENPWPKGRATGSRAKGLAYEKLIAKALPKARQNVWVQFCDANGEGYCCPDFVLKLDGRIVILEAKLTDCPEAYSQLSKLYIPVFQHLLRTDDVRGVVIAHNLHRNSLPPAFDIPSALELPPPSLVHWLGSTALIP